MADQWPPCCQFDEDEDSGGTRAARTAPPLRELEPRRIARRRVSVTDESWGCASDYARLQRDFERDRESMRKEAERNGGSSPRPPNSSDVLRFGGPRIVQHEVETLASLENDLSARGTKSAKGSIERPSSAHLVFDLQLLQVSHARVVVIEVRDEPVGSRVSALSEAGEARRTFHASSPFG